MTMTELQQYIDLKAELEELQEELDSLNRKGLVVDKVQASNQEYPYQPISATITGIVEDAGFRWFGGGHICKLKRTGAEERGKSSRKGGA